MHACCLTKRVCQSSLPPRCPQNEVKLTDFETIVLGSLSRHGGRTYPPWWPNLPGNQREAIQACADARRSDWAALSIGGERWQLS